MKISNSKKELARIISENGGWRDGNYAIQDKDDMRVWFSHKIEGKPCGNPYWPCHKSHAINHHSLLPNWHQSILSREEYFHLYPAQDDDGWIEWDGGECPVDYDCEVSIKVRGESGSARGKAKHWSWGHSGDDSDIVAYRLHNHDQSKTESCESVTRSIPEPETKPTIEQLAADYRNRKDYADRKQTEADAAKTDAEAKLEELVAAGKALNLVISVSEKEPEMVITDWRDLQVGDEIEYLGGTSSDFIGSVGVVELIDEDDDFHILFRFGEKGDSSNPEDWMSTRWCSKFRFVRRP